MERVVGALVKHISKENSNDLLVGESDIHLILNGKKPFKSVKENALFPGPPKPRLVTVPHSLHLNDSICLIVKDPHYPLKALIKANAQLSKIKVIGVGRLRKKYKSFEQQRQLRDSYDIFIADDRVVPMLPGIIGKVFYDKKSKIPIGMDMQKGTIEAISRAIAKVKGSTFLFPNTGTCVNVKVGNTGQSVHDIVENINASVVRLLDESKLCQWANIRNISIKGKNSTSLPIYQIDLSNYAD